MSSCCPVPSGEPLELRVPGHRTFLSLVGQSQNKRYHLTSYNSTGATAAYPSAWLSGSRACARQSLALAILAAAVVPTVAGVSKILS